MMINVRSVRPRAMLLILLCALIPMVSACQGDAQSEAELLTQAEEHIRGGDRPAAVIELQNLLQTNAENAQARWLLGRTQLELGNAAAAVKELSRALELGWPPGDIAVPLARALLLLNPTGVVDGLAVLGDESRLPDGVRGELSLVRGLAMLRTGESQGAAAELAAASQISPGSPAAGMADALLAFSRGDLDRAREAVERVLEVQPERAEALAMRGDLALAGGDAEAAAGAYTQALEAEPGNPLFRLALARAQLQTGAEPEAIATLGPVLKNNPRFPDANFLRAVAAFQSQDFSTAQTFADKALEVSPGDTKSHFVAGAAAYERGQYERAFEHLRRIAPARADTDGTQFLVQLFAATQMKLGMVDEAVKTVSAMDNGASVDAKFLGELGKAVAAVGHTQAGQWMLARAAAQDPDNVETQVALGVARMQLGDEAGSLEALERAIAIAPETTESQAMAVLLHLRKGEFDAALAGARKFAEDHPTLSTGQTLLGTVHAVSGRRAEARDAFERALEMDAGDLDALNNLGHVYYEEQQWEKARNALKSVADKRGSDLAGLLKLAVAESRLGREQEAMAWLEQAVAKFPAEPAPRAALARVHLASGRAAEAVDIVFDFSVNRELTTELRDLLGRAQLQLGQFQAAAKTLQVLPELRPDDIQAHRNLARALEGAGQIDAALRAINRAHDLEPEHKPTRFTRAKLLTLAGQFAEARAVVGDLKKEHPNSVELVDLEGAIALGSGDFAAAVAAYQHAFERRETNMQLMKLARALMSAGQVKEAETRLQTWLQAHPEDLLTRTVLANYLLNQQRTAAAQEQFGKLVELKPNDALARNNLAWLLLQSGKKDEALAQAQQAYALAPENPHILDTLGDVLLAYGGRGEQALPLLQKAAGALPEDRAVQVNLAKALAQTGDVQKARALLQKSVAGDQQFRNRAEAEALLKSLTLLGGSSG